MLVPAFPPRFDGVGDHSAKFARALLDRGDDVLVLTEGESRAWDGVKAVGIGPKWSVAATLRAIFHAAKFRPDAFYVQYTPFTYGVRSFAPLLFAFAARASRRPLGVYVHEAFYPAGSAAARTALRAFVLAVRDGLLVSVANRSFVASEQRRRTIRKHVPWKRSSAIVVAPMGANVEPPPGRRWVPAGAAASRKSLVAFGIVAPRRRLELIVDTLPILEARGLDVELRILGRIADEQYARNLSERARAANVEKRLRWLGGFDPEGVTQELFHASALLFASEYGMTASSTVLLAGLAHGVPIVAVETAEDEATFAPVVLSTGSNASSLADAIEATLIDVNSAAARAALGAELYQRRYAWSSLAANVCVELESSQK